MKFATRFLVVVSGVAILASCSGGNMAGDSIPSVSQPPLTSGVSDFPAKVGTPYQIGDVNYKPEDVAAYDDVGYASYYGEELAGNKTANGEMFVPGGITAAHKTLPLPSYVEVTALDTGRTILVRINDRGPFANDRLIDLSAGAAQQLGIAQQGVAGVRVRKVNPPEQERAALRSGRAVSERIATPESLLRVLNMKLAKQPRPSGGVRTASVPRPNAAPNALPNQPAVGSSQNGRFIREGGSAPNAAARPVATARPVAVARPPAAPRPAQSQDGRFIREGAGAVQTRAAPQAGASGYVVQLASYSSKTRADQLARSIGASVQQSSDGALFRVRMGPYASEAEAQRGLATAQQRGYPQARIFRE
jgi:rare lipoprotein A